MLTSNAESVTKVCTQETPVVKSAITVGAIIAMACSVAAATPSPEIAKQCLRAAYLLYPYKRPGAAPMNGDRLLYFKKCMAEHDVVSPDQNKEFDLTQPKDFPDQKDQAR
jgi:hypothetical protein